jgi:hypothetical protein
MVLLRCSSSRTRRDVNPGLRNSVWSPGDRKELRDSSELSAFNGASGRLGVCCGLEGGPTTVFLGRMPSFSFKVSGRSAVNEEKAIFSLKSPTLRFH